MNSSSRGNNRAIHAYFVRSKECAIYTLVLSFSTFIFVASMILTVYMTHIASLDRAVVLLIVGSCLLYLLSFCSNMYSIYRIKPTSTPTENADNFNRLSQFPEASAPSTSTNIRSPDVVSIPRARELFRKTPPPPYEVQMSEMSRMLQPGTSRTTEPSEREAEIAEEARKLIQRLYEEMRRTDQLATQSLGEQSVQQVIQTPKPPVRQQEMMSKVSHQNLVVQRQQAVGKSSPSRGIPPVGFRANQVIEQKVAANSFPTQLDLGRLVIGSEGCSPIPLQRSPRISSHSPVDFRPNQAIQQKVTPNSYPTRPDVEKFIIGNEGCAVAPQLSPRSEEFLKVARKRKLTCSSQELQSRSKIKENISQVAAADKDFPNNEYEEIEVVGSVRSTNSSQAAYDTIEREFEDPSEQAFRGTSAVSLNLAEPKRKFGIPSAKPSRQLSILSTRKFCQLGRSPETVLDAIATCFDLTPDEWMVAWKLSQQNVSPEERARFLGVCLQEGSYNVDN